MTRPTWLGAIAIAGLLLGSALAAEPARADGTAVPQVGECHELTTAQISRDSETSAPVPCTGTHTTEVVGVPTLPAGVPFDHSSRFLEAAQGACTQPFGKAVAGGDFRKIALSDLSFAFFVPTQAQQQAGARWIRCDAFLLSPGEPPPLPGPAPYLRHGIPDAVARCSTSQLRAIPCDKPHSYRAVFSFKLMTAQPPTDKQASAIAAKRCPPRTGKGPYLFANTSGAVYQAGWRTLECEMKTTG